LAGLKEHEEDFADEDIRVFLASADDRDGAEEMKRDEELGFPVLHGLDVDDIRDRFGLYIERGAPTHLQPAQFILRPDGTIRLACYSSGRVGRLDAGEVLDIIRSAKAD